MKTTSIWRRPKYEDDLELKKPDLEDRTRPELTQPKLCLFLDSFPKVFCLDHISSTEKVCYRIPLLWWLIKLGVKTENVPPTLQNILWLLKVFFMLHNSKSFVFFISLEINVLEHHDCVFVKCDIHRFIFSTKLFLSDIRVNFFVGHPVSIVPASSYSWFENDGF